MSPRCLSQIHDEHNAARPLLDIPLIDLPGAIKPNRIPQPRITGLDGTNLLSLSPSVGQLSTVSNSDNQPPEQSGHDGINLKPANRDLPLSHPQRANLTHEQ